MVQLVDSIAVLHKIITDLKLMYHCLFFSSITTDLKPRFQYLFSPSHN